MGAPEWKKKLIVKKEVELARMQKVEEERLRVQKEEEARFNAMPDWKKRLVSHKRADVQFKMFSLFGMNYVYIHANNILNIS